MVKNRERILEAIDQLRRRKARPDIPRICNYLFRRFAIPSGEAKADLQWCVDNGVVLKVEYKGSISYRNAAKKHLHTLDRIHRKNHWHGSRDADPHHPAPSASSSSSTSVHHPNNSAASSSSPSWANRKFAQLLTTAMGELVVEEPDYLDLGVPEIKIIDNVLAKDSVRYTKKYISILIDKEVQNGGLVRMENGHYLMGREETDVEERGDVAVASAIDDIGEGGVRGCDPAKSTTKQALKTGKKYLKTKVGARKQEMMDGDEKKPESGNSLRVGGRRKRARKVFDPSDTHVPKKRGRPIGSLNRATIEKQNMSRQSNDDSRPGSRTSSNGREQGGVCSVCHLQNKKANDKLVSCRECSNKAHYSCLNGHDMMLRMYPDNTWRCPHCKTCVVCFETSDAGSLTVCAICADAYHSTCHTPRISDERSKTKWLCINCEMPEELKINEIQSNVTSAATPTRNSPSQDDVQDDKKGDLSEDSDSPAVDDSSSSISGNSTPTNNYNSPPLSPTPPHLSPQNTSLDNDIVRPSQFNSSRNSCASDLQSVKSMATKDDMDEDIDPSIPDATHWTAEEVYQYFAQYFPEEAHIFRDQEIDGRSLLLLRRIDVLTSLNLKLGPALKIYRHVVKLQVRRDDPKLYWL